MAWRDLDIGAVSAYAIAVEHGYTGTEEEWASEQAAAGENARIAKESAKTAVAAAKAAQSNLDSIKPNTEQAITDIQTEGNTQRSSVTSTGDAQNQRVMDTGAEQSRALSAQGNVEQRKVIATGDEQVSRVTNTGNDAVESVTLEKTNAINSVQSTKTDAVNSVETAKTSAVEAVKSAESAAIQNIGTGVDDTLSISGKAADAKKTGDSINSLKDDLDSKAQFGDPYDGVDLTVKHAKEIENYASPWSWIKARIAAGNFSQLHVGDYIPFTTTNGRTFQAQIAGINTYKGYGNTEVGNHIDFITRELWPDTFQMNLVNFNNGTAGTKQVPWLASNGYLFVNSLAGQVPNGKTLPLDMVDKDYTAGGMYFYLPDDLKSVIVEKRTYAPTRYSASGVLTNDNNGAWVNLGKLWLPDEYEVTGARLMTSTGQFCGGYVQYPIFAGNMNRLKRANGSRSLWWLSSALAGDSINFVTVSFNGPVIYVNASDAYRAPFCFRVS